MHLKQVKGLVLGMLLLLLAACSGKPFAIEHKAEASPVRQNSVFVVDHGWHTGFVLPSDVINRDFPFLLERFGRSQSYYEFGWGDKGFYQSHEITTGLTLEALFWSSGSVVHVVSVDEPLLRYFSDSEIIEIRLSDNEFQDLRKFIADSFAYDKSGNVIKLTSGLYGDSQFYEGSGTYHILNTCNKWTAKGLKSAGMDISIGFKLTASSIMRGLRNSGSNVTVIKAPGR